MHCYFQSCLVIPYMDAYKDTFFMKCIHIHTQVNQHTPKHASLCLNALYRSSLKPSEICSYWYTSNPHVWLCDLLAVELCFFPCVSVKGVGVKLHV